MKPRNGAMEPKKRQGKPNIYIDIDILIYLFTESYKRHLIQHVATCVCWKRWWGWA